ncbi:MAG: DNA methyltransferase [Rhodospirillaceae bacterium]
MKAELRKKAFDLYLSCHSQDEIAAAVGYSRQAVGKFIEQSSFATSGDTAVCGETLDSDAGSDDEEEKENGLGRIKLTKEQVAIAAHDVNFEVPLYNIWKQQTKTAGASHFGNSEVRWVDNLLYLYTKPFDIVVDPFGGGGSTIDLCKKRLRRYHVSDRKPVVERAAAAPTPPPPTPPRRSRPAAPRS